MKKSALMMFMVFVLVAGLLAGCSGNKSGGNTDTGADTSSGASADAGSAASTDSDASGTDLSGDITVLTQRTDIVDTLQKDFTAEFNKEYPNIKVKWEALQDYEKNIKIRMNTADYGDVLLIPNNIEPKDYPTFFEPLGDFEADKTKYAGISDHKYQDKYYGIPMAINTLGIVYNKKVFQEAGIDQMPRTPSDFIEALKKIKANTKAIPLYTNYHDSWALTQWEAYLQPASGDPDYPNIGFLEDPHPWLSGKPINDIYKLMYDVAKQGLIENDPTTTDWESSKGMMNRGEIGTMVLGSWAVPQMQGAGPNKDDVGYMPFPTNADRLSSPTAGDYNWAVNVHSKNKEAAKAFIHWVVDKSDYATKYQGGMSPVYNAEGKLDVPDMLVGFKELGVNLEQSTPSPEELNGMVTKIDNDSEVGLFQDAFPKRIIEAAIGNRDESFDAIMQDLDNKWNKSWSKLMPDSYKNKK